MSVERKKAVLKPIKKLEPKKRETQQKEVIEEYYNSMDPRNIEFEDAVELVVDHLMDEELVDLSEDENGDMHEDLYNTVWEHLESYIG